MLYVRAWPVLGVATARADEVHTMTRTIRLFAIVTILSACGGNTPPPKTEAPPDDPLGRGSGATAPLPPDDAGATAAPPPADTAGASDVPTGATAIAKNQASPSGLALLGGSIYFVNELEGAVMRIGAGAGVTEIAYTAPSPFTGRVYAVADAKSIYFAAPAAAGGSVFKLDKEQSTPVVLASGIKETFRAIAIDASNAYWVAGDNVLKVAKGGGTPAAVAAVQRDPTSVASDGHAAHWSTAGDGQIWRSAARGADVVVKGADKPGCLAFDDTSLYFCAGAKVMKAPKAGGAATAVATADATVTNVALDSVNVVWATATSVGRAPKAGGEGAVLAKGLKQVTALAVDATGAYVCTHGTEEKKFRDGMVLKIAK